MADFIDRDNFIDRKMAVDTVLAFDKEYYGETLLMEVALKLTGLPKADTERHAHWIKNTVSSGQNSWTCSKCGRRARGKKENLPYCHCGCKMDEVSK